MINKALIEALKDGRSETLKTVYLKYKSSFMGFAKRYPLDETTITDIYQDAIIALRENAINGKLDTLKSELKTYLFSIGKYMIYKKLKQDKSIHLVEDINQFDSLQNPSEFAVDLTEALTDEQEQLRLAFKSLGKKCKDLLTLFYYRGFDLDEITTELNYNNKDVVKSQKSRCLKSLRAMIFKN